MMVWLVLSGAARCQGLREMLGIAGIPAKGYKDEEGVGADALNSPPPSSKDSDGKREGERGSGGVGSIGGR
jgi:hypothetical protein